MNLNEQVVLVTGAGQGIGQAIAAGFGKAGSAVVVNDLNLETAVSTATQINNAGGRALGIQANITDRSAIDNMLAQAKAHFGPITTLINNAGYSDFFPFMEYPIDNWKNVLDVDLNGVFHCTQAVVPQMEEAGAGFIVNIASIHATQALKNMSIYAAAKAGVVALTKNLAQELGPKNIRVNCLSPGTIETDALVDYFKSLPDETREAQRDHMLSWCSVGRFGKPSDIANVALFLCSEQAAFVHGTEIVADGGHLARLF